MKKIVPTYLFLTSILIISCNKSTINYKYSDPVYKTTYAYNTSQLDAYYEETKTYIAHKNKLFKEEYLRSNASHQSTLIELSKNYIYTTLKDTIFPIWYDTRWDYNGTTQHPRSGNIACGYFVTTCLRDMGFKIERARLAQQASANIIKSLCGSNMHIIGHNNLKGLEKYLSSKKDGIYIIGLDNHVGFIVKEGNSLHAVHSNGISGSLEVVKEPMTQCKLIQKSKAYYIGDLMANTSVFKAWIKNEKIPTTT